MEFPNKLFVTGTDTDIGKTVVSSILTIGLKAGYWKPIQAGTEPDTDTKRVEKWTQLPANHFYKETYCLKTPMSPHAAAELENIYIELSDFELPEFSQKHLIIEGAGGLIVPVNNEFYVIDLIKSLEVPALLVAKSGLGTLNHTLLSIEALRQRSIKLLGVVMVGEPHLSNEEAILYYGKVKHLFRVPLLSELNSHSLLNVFNQQFVTD